MNNADKRRIKKHEAKKARDMRVQNPNKLREDTAGLPRMLRKGWKLRNHKSHIPN